MGPDSGVGEETTVWPCASVKTKSRDLAPARPFMFSGSFSPGFTAFTPAVVSTHSPRALRTSSSQRGRKEGGSVLGAGGEGSGLYWRPNSTGLTSQ